MNPTLTHEMSGVLTQAVRMLRPLAGTERFDPAVPAAIVASGLHRAPVPIIAGGLGANLGQSVELLSALSAVDGSCALGLAMHFHTLGAAVESGNWPKALLSKLFREVVTAGALVNIVATEEMGGSPARGALPEMTALRKGSVWVVNGVKHWATWLPALRYAVITVRFLDQAWMQAAASNAEIPVGSLLLDLKSPGVERLPAFDALGMCASASGMLRLNDVMIPGEHLIISHSSLEPAPRRASAQAWFGLCVAAVYLGIGEGARHAVVDWAVARKPGNTATAVADLPLIRVRMGRIDSELRTARILLTEIARRWDQATALERPEMLLNVALAKFKATQAAAYATDEALRIAGGPGYLRGYLERAFRDARAGLIHPPLEDIVMQDLALGLVARARAGIE